jgi:tetratricopeptide (TPR) repeat protein
MFQGMLERLRVYRKYAKRLWDVVRFRSCFFQAYDIHREPRVFIDASTCIYSICSAAILISTVFYFALSASRPDIYEIIPLTFMITMGLTSFILISILGVEKVTFRDFFVSFAYVMSAYCVFWVLGRTIWNGYALYHSNTPTITDLPQILDIKCRDRDSAQCIAATQKTSIRQVLAFTGHLREYWELFIGAYFSLALGVFLARRDQSHSLRIAVAIMAGLGTFIFFEKGMGYAVKVWLHANGCASESVYSTSLDLAYSDISVGLCENYTNYKLPTVRYYAHWRYAHALRNQAAHRKGQDNYERSITEFIEAIKIDPDFKFEPNFVDQLSELGGDYAAKGHAEGLTLVSAAVRGRPDDPRLLISRGSIHLDAGDLEGAAADFNEAIAGTEKSPMSAKEAKRAEAYFFLGLVQEKKNDLEAAREAYTKAKDLQPEDARFLRSLGRLQSISGDNDEAIKYLRRALTLDSEENGLGKGDGRGSRLSPARLEGISRTNLELGQAYQGKKMRREAEKRYFNAIRFDKNYADAHYALAILYSTWPERKSRSEEFRSRALVLYNKIWAVNKSSTTALIGQGNCKFHSGAYSAAIQAYSSAISINPNDAAYFILRGDAYVQLGERDRAIADYRTAIALYNPNKYAYNKSVAADVYYKIGTQLSRSRKHEDAIEAYDNSIGFTPQQAAYLESRGKEHQARGEYREAIEDYSKALDLKPNVAVVWARKCALRAVSGEGEMALSDCDRAEKEAIESKPDIPELLAYYKGVAFWNCGKKEDAKRAYREALDLAKRYEKEEEEKDQRTGKLSRRTAAALANVSWYALFAHDYEGALVAADRAIGLAPSVLWPKRNRVHALMFQDGNNPELVQRFYLEREGETLASWGPWNTIIEEDFRDFRDGGLHDRLELMKKVEEAFGVNK